MIITKAFVIVIAFVVVLGCVYFSLGLVHQIAEVISHALGQ